MGGSDIAVDYYRKTQNSTDSRWEQWEKFIGGDLAYFTITSLENSPGIIYETWKDGDEFRITINKNTNARYYIKPEKYKFMNLKENCQEDSYYGCVAKQLDANEFKNCSKKCIPRIFSDLGINLSKPFCYQNDTEAEHCALDIGNNIVKQKISSNCMKSCSNLRYFGDISGIIPFTSPGKNNWYFFT